MYLADYALDKGIKSMLFRQWFEYFVSEDVLFEEFSKYTSTGSTKKQKVNGRTAIMAKSLAEYFEIDGKYKLLESEVACEFSAKFQSVIGTGKLCLISDKEEKINNPLL